MLDGRYHHRSLRSPREVRRALAYVLLNARRHLQKQRRAAGRAVLDGASSARWFDGWRPEVASRLLDAPEPRRPEVARPRTWLLRIGWRRLGRIDPGELPALG